MCGIAGIALNANRAFADLQQRVQAMCEAMTHRGPDDAGLYISQNTVVALGNRRLAIRDLSPAGHMPMCNADGTVWITYNGEVYNTEELRFELERLGYTFRSSSDTEIVLHGYEAWGEDVVHYLRGMFALAILDQRTKTDGQRRASADNMIDGSLSATGRLFLARDRLGIKPLYYAQTPDALVFASELKGLLASGLVSRQLAPAAVVAFLMMGSVPCPLTIYRGVQALEPGCMLTWQNGRIEVRRYWDLPINTMEPGSYKEAIEQVRSLLEEAVRIRLVSDVPLGAFLSGGLDSSTVVALMRRATNGPIRTCSMVFEESEYSEAPYARVVAEAVGAEHYERVVTGEDVAAELDRIFWVMDQPTVDGVNTYFVSKVAREAGLTVALSGLGGDELFGGYPNTFRGIPRMLRALRLIQAVPAGPYLGQLTIGWLSRHRRWAKVRDVLTRPISPASAYLASRGLFSPTEVRALVGSDIWHESMKVFDPVEYIAERSDGSPVSTSYSPSVIRHQLFSWISRAELRTYTHNTLLRDTDVMSMAHSLEVRVPLLDHRLVEAVLCLPEAVKVNGTGPKPLMVEAVGNALPAMVRERREKHGFVFPFDYWMRGVLRTRAQEAVKQMGATGWVNSSAVHEIWATYQAGKVHWSRPWGLVALSTWMTQQGSVPWY